MMNRLAIALLLLLAVCRQSANAETPACGFGLLSWLNADTLPSFLEQDARRCFAEQSIQFLIYPNAIQKGHARNYNSTDSVPTYTDFERTVYEVVVSNNILAFEQMTRQTPLTQLNGRNANGCWVDGCASDIRLLCCPIKPDAVAAAADGQKYLDCSIDDSYVREAAGLRQTP
jgi:hypothetical protein